VIASHDSRPLIFLDVDGPLIPFRARPAGHGLATSDALASAEVAGNPMVDRLDPADGRRLLALGCDLVWATTWMDDANEIVAPRLGLPLLPVLDFPDDEDIPVAGLHWKTKFLTDWASGRPFVWLDDEITEADRQWVSSHHHGIALLHRVDPFAGLTEADFSMIRQWLSCP
jgi:Swiss Army Knife RNA repair-like protein